MFCKKCPACAAKDQTIAALADQIDWLRMQFAIGAPGLKKPVFGPTSPLDEDPKTYVVDRSMHMSEEEEDLRAMHGHGDISDGELAAALAQVREAAREMNIVP